MSHCLEQERLDLEEELDRLLGESDRLERRIENLDDELGNIAYHDCDCENCSYDEDGDEDEVG